MTSNSILVLGAAGMAGHMIEAFLREKGHHVTGADIRSNPHASEPLQRVDFRRQPDLVALLKSHPWDVVVNAVGVLNKSVDSHPEDGIFLNSVLPHLLSKTLREGGGRLIHLSTDCVFSGQRGRYGEDDFRDGDSLYDRSKALGEVVNDRDLTFRQSIIGPDTNPAGIGLFNWFMQAPSDLEGYTNAIWNGVTTLQLAKGINTIITSLPLTGIYHHITPEPISKHNLLALFAKEFRRDVSIRPKAMPSALDKSLVNTRPQTALSIPDYTVQLKEMRLWIEQHAAWYSHYRLN
jgi:dTDP-4-dehydrorhamnose reductase